MRRFTMPESVCPWCGNEFNACSDPYGLDSPQAGDGSVCIKCAGLLIFDANLFPKKLEGMQLSQFEYEDKEGYAKLIQVQSTIRKASTTE